MSLSRHPGCPPARAWRHSRESGNLQRFAVDRI